MDPPALMRCSASRQIRFCRDETELLERYGLQDVVYTYYFTSKTRLGPMRHHVVGGGGAWQFDDHVWSRLPNVYYVGTSL